MLKDNIWLLFAILVFVVYCMKNDSVEDFYVWNIPTRWPKLPYDIRNYPYYYLHRGKIFSSNYINLDLYPEVQYYLPYYNNGMIYTASGNYTYDSFSKMYPNYPIIYPTYEYPIDWIGMRRNGII